MTERDCNAATAATTTAVAAIMYLLWSDKFFAQILKLVQFERFEQDFFIKSSELNSAISSAAMEAGL